jgi:hypothetical protein
LACNGNGKCISVDYCKCDKNYTGDDCSITTCFDVANTNSTVCSGNGNCLKYNKCSCDTDSKIQIKKIGGVGGECEINICFDKMGNTTETCSGNGKCLGPNKCECTGLYIGESCSNAIILIVIIIIIFLLLLLLLILIIFSIVATIIFIILIRVIRNNKLLNKKMSLQNQELSRKLALINDMNKIPFKNIRFDKIKKQNVILGKGIFFNKKK